MSQTADRVDAAVSYSRADQARVEQLIAGLKASGLIIWFDKDIPGGALWEEIIARKYRASGALLFFVSRASLASQRCSEEVSTARTLGKPIIPILLDPLKLPDDLPDRFVLTLQARNTVNAYERSPEDAEQAVLAALAGFGVTPGALPTPLPPPVARPLSQPPEPAQKRRRGGAWIAFGGAAFALVLVAGAYFMFVRPKPPSAVESTSQSTAAISPSSSPKPAPTEPAVTPPAGPAAAPPKPDKVALGPTTVALDKTAYVEGDKPVVTVKGLAGNDKDWVALSKAGTPDTVYLDYQYTKGVTDGRFTLKPILTAGRYEVRVYFNDNGDKTVRARQTFDVAPFPPPTLALDHDTYAEGQPVKVTVAGMLGADRDWVAIAEAGAAPGVFVSYEYTKGAKDTTLTLKPLMKPGSYEARAYFDDTTGDKTIRASEPFEVTAAEPVALMPDGDFYAPGAEMDVAFSGMPGNARDWISIAKEGSADTTYVAYVNTEGQTAGTAELRAPADPGTYELRAYFDDSTGDKTVRGRAAFEVTEAAPELPQPAPGPSAAPEPAEEPAAEPPTEPAEPSLEPQAEPVVPPEAEPNTGAEPEVDCADATNVTTHPDRCPLDCTNPAHVAAFPDQCPTPP